MLARFTSLSFPGLPGHPPSPLTSSRDTQTTRLYDWSDTMTSPAFAAVMIRGRTRRARGFDLGFTRDFCWVGRRRGLSPESERWAVVTVWGSRHDHCCILRWCGAVG